MKLDTKCCMCGRLDEDGGHLLFKCKEVKPVWRALNLEAIRCKLKEAGSAKEMMEMVLKLKEREQLTVIMLLWLWWGARNTLRSERKAGGAQFLNSHTLQRFMLTVFRKWRALAYIV